MSLRILRFYSLLWTAKLRKHKQHFCDIFASCLNSPLIKFKYTKTGSLFAVVPLHAPDMIRGVTICFLLGDTFTLSMPLINSLLSVADSTARNLTERMCWVSFAIVIMLPASRDSPLTGLASLDISVIFTPALFVICSKREKRCDDGGFAGGTSTVEATKDSP